MNVRAPVATGMKAVVPREVLRLQVTSAEEVAGLLVFFPDLAARGLPGVALVTSDAH